MNFINKLRKQPEHIRKLILWSVVIIVGLGLAIFWLYSSYRALKKFSKEEFIKGLDLPSFEEELKELPKPEMPQFNEEELKMFKVED